MADNSNQNTGEEYIIEMRNISKGFGAVQALQDVNFKLRPGEVLGLVGDNSAGKSTLMKVLTGAYTRDSGDVIVSGTETHFRGPHDSRERGIEMIYQDFALCGNMDIAQNIFLGRWPSNGFFLNRRRMYDEASKVLQRLKVDVNSVFQRVESLSGGRQQSVAIARAISFEPKVVILDEPTANLSVMATERLLETMVELKAQGVAQVIISHRLTDIFEVGDRVMVLKRGENVGDRFVNDVTEHEVLELIVAGTPQTAMTAEDHLAQRNSRQPSKKTAVKPRAISTSKTGPARKSPARKAPARIPASKSAASEAYASKTSPGKKSSAKKPSSKAVSRKAPPAARPTTAKSAPKRTGKKPASTRNRKSS